jgi:hypothetical protein
VHFKVALQSCSRNLSVSQHNSLRTVHTQKNGGVSEVDKNCISRPTLAAAETVQVSHMLPAVHFLCLLQGRGARFKYGVTEGVGGHCGPIFWGVIFDYN